MSLALPKHQQRQQQRQAITAYYPPSRPSYTYRENNVISNIAQTVLFSLPTASLLYSITHFLASKLITLSQSTFLHHYKIWNVAKWILLPIAVCQILSLIAKTILLPAWIYKFSSARLSERSQLQANLLENEDQYKELGFTFSRRSIDVEGHLIDVMVIYNNRNEKIRDRFTSFALGNGEFYEQKLHKNFLCNTLIPLDTNAILFNYPSVFGSSFTLPSSSLAIKTCRAVRCYLEEVMHATEIISLSRSIGVGFQAEADRDHDFTTSDMLSLDTSKIKYVAIRDRGFKDLETVASQSLPLPRSITRVCLYLMGWELSPFTSSQKLPIPELIIQTGNNHWNREVKITEDPNEISDDNVIDARSSLAHAILSEDYNHLKEVFVMPGSTHNTPLDFRGLNSRIALEVKQALHA